MAAAWHQQIMLTVTVVLQHRLHHHGSRWRVASMTPVYARADAATRLLRVRATTCCSVTYAAASRLARQRGNMTAALLL